MKANRKTLAEKREELGIEKPHRRPHLSGVRAKNEIEQYVSRYQQFADGSLTVEDLTLDELTRGRLMDKNGGFGGAPPARMPPGLYNAMVKELQKRMNDKFKNHAIDAIETIVDVMENGEGEQFSAHRKAGTGRFKAAQYVVERIIGKVPDRVEVNQNTTIWEGAQESGSMFIDVEVEDDIPYQEEEQYEEKPRRRGPRTQPKARTNPSRSAD